MTNRYLSGPSPDILHVTHGHHSGQLFKFWQQGNTNYNSNTYSDSNINNYSHSRGHSYTGANINRYSDTEPTPTVIPTVSLILTPVPARTSDPAPSATGGEFFLQLIELSKTEVINISEYGTFGNQHNSSVYWRCFDNCLSHNSSNDRYHIGFFTPGRWA